MISVKKLAEWERKSRNSLPTCGKRAYATITPVFFAATNMLKQSNEYDARNAIAIALSVPPA